MVILDELSGFHLFQIGIDFGTAFGFFGAGLAQQLFGGEAALAGFFAGVDRDSAVNPSFHLAAQAGAFGMALGAQAGQLVIFGAFGGGEERLSAALVCFGMVEQPYHGQGVEIVGNLGVVAVAERTVCQSVGVLHQLPAFFGELVFGSGWVLRGSGDGQAGEKEEEDFVHGFVVGGMEAV